MINSAELVQQVSAGVVQHIMSVVMIPGNPVAFQQVMLSSSQEWILQVIANGSPMGKLYVGMLSGREVIMLRRQGLKIGEAIVQ